MISHANVMAQLRAAIARADMDELPRADLAAAVPRLRPGLGVLLAFAAGGRSDLMPAHAFMRSPLSWWQTAARRGSTHSGAPHFAYVAVLEALAEQPDWHADLSALRCCPAAPSRSAPRRWTGSSPRLARLGVGPVSSPRLRQAAEAVLGVSAPAPEPARAPRLRTLDREALHAGRAQDARSGPRSVACGALLPGLRAAHRRSADPARLRGHAHRRALAAGRERGAGLLGPRRRQRGCLRRARDAEGDGPWRCAPVTSPSGTRANCTSPAA